MLWKRRRKEEPAPLHTPEEPEFWRRLSVGSSVALRDFQALEEADLTGTGAGGLNYEVTGKRHYTFRGAGGGVVAEYLLFDIADAETVYVLAAVLTGPHLELRVYYQPDGFQPGTRAALLDHGFAWLFLEPPNPDSFVPYELEFAPHPEVPPIRDGDEEKLLEFNAVNHGPLYGDFHDERARRRVPALVMEYRTEQPASNPLLLVLEEGGLDADGEPVPDGGFVTLLLGGPTDLSQMEVYAR
jgi:hypothetical protein